MTSAYDLHISGIVQGVGFRPFIYRLARHWGLVGWVLNANDGVHMRIEGDTASLRGFIDELPTRAPTAADITSLEVADAPVEGLTGFDIHASDSTAEANTLVSPDIATCPDCLRELFDESDRRFHYPFINCTSCGPRFTIIDALPYDRPNTSMAPFEMCDACAHEYRDPLDRRFHAQPDACFDCGPTLRLWVGEDGAAGAGVSGGAAAGVGVADASGGAAAGAAGAGPNPERTQQRRAESDALISQAASLLAAGRIVAIKGLGGYHLACDATNEEAVALLRRRKKRSAKPFALMVRTVDDARALCKVSAQEAELLAGTVRPIVLLERRGRDSQAPMATEATAPPTANAPTTAPATPGQLAPSVAGTLHELGIMLPSTPVQHLLMAAVDVPLVMTSGNISEEPIIAHEAEAHELLGGVADAFLDNNREILSRYDDSVVRVVDGRVLMVRRARGHAPRPLPFKTAQTSNSRTSVLAVGPEQKSTFCLAQSGQAFISQHLGDLESASSFGAWRSTLSLYRLLFGLDYTVIAHDLHPDYLSTRWARAQDEARVGVQHHHAHIASILAEHRTGHAATGDIALTKTVIGIAFDGGGYGEDGAIWGGEALIAGLEDFERFAHLRYTPLPGGRAAIDNPERMAWAHLRTLGLTDHPGAAPLATGIGADRLLLLDQIIASGVNCPETSSMGRLFDAVSALAGICTRSSYEGQAAVELEAALYDPTTGVPVTDPEGRDGAERYRFAFDDAAEPRVIDPEPVIAAVLADREALVPAALLSLRFHNAVVWLIADLCEAARLRYGLGTVALGGGVFMNRYLVTHVVSLLESEGFVVLLNRELPANDGCISYGQAAVAAARLEQLADAGVVLGE
jgi:hydrogenase maturation protein HypF